MKHINRVDKIFRLMYERKAREIFRIAKRENGAKEK
jgi:hypothetical protein